MKEEIKMEANIIKFYSINNSLASLWSNKKRNWRLLLKKRLMERQDNTRGKCHHCCSQDSFPYGSIQPQQTLCYHHKLNQNSPNRNPCFFMGNRQWQFLFIFYSSLLKICVFLFWWKLNRVNIFLILLFQMIILL